MTREQWLELLLREAVSAALTDHPGPGSEMLPVGVSRCQVRMAAVLGKLLFALGMPPRDAFDMILVLQTGIPMAEDWGEPDDASKRKAAIKNAN